MIIEIRNPKKLFAVALIFALFGIILDNYSTQLAFTKYPDKVFEENCVPKEYIEKYGAAEGMIKAENSLIWGYILVIVIGSGLLACVLVNVTDARRRDVFLFLISGGLALVGVLKVGAGLHNLILIFKLMAGI